MTRTIILASSNAGKLSELTRLLPQGFDVRSASEFDIALPPETGSTFEQNASIKALHTARETGLLAIGDDSGLVVDALGGAPGIFSARFAGHPPSDARNIAKLLADLAGVPATARTARFQCAVTLASPTGAMITRHGEIEGSIGFEKRGSNGFGYDPVFVIPDGRSFAELDADAKDGMSHRGVALRALIPDIAPFAAASEKHEAVN